MTSAATAPLLAPATRPFASTNPNTSPNAPPHATTAADTRPCPDRSSGVALRALRVLQATLVLDLVVNLVYGTRARLWIVWSLALARIITVVVLIALHTRRLGLGVAASRTAPHPHHHARSHHHHSHSSRHRIHWIGIHVLLALLACLWYLNELVQRQILSFPTRHRTIAFDLSALVQQFIHDPRAFYPSLSLAFALIEYVAFILVNHQPQQAPYSTPRTRRATFGSMHADSALHRPRVQGGDLPHQPDSDLFPNDADLVESDVDQDATEIDTNTDTTETDTEAEADENEIIDVPKRGSAGETTGASLRSRASRASFFASAAENGLSPRAVEQDVGVGVGVGVRNRSTSTSSQAFRPSQNYGALSQSNRSFGGI